MSARRQDPLQPPVPDPRHRRTGSLKAAGNALLRSSHGYLVLAAGASVIALAAALVMQYGLGLPPCDLCIEQRWGFAVAGVLAGGGMGAHRIGIPQRIAVVGVGLAFLATAGLAVRHVGVEQAWWPGPDTCTAAGADARTTDELLEAIMKAPLVRCDEVPATWLGLSIAGWVVVTASVLSALAAVVVVRDRSGRR